MTTSVRFYISYGPLKWNLLAFIPVLDMDITNNVTCTRQSAITRVVIQSL